MLVPRGLDSEGNAGLIGTQNIKKAKVKRKTSFNYLNARGGTTELSQNYGLGQRITYDFL